MLSSIWIAGGTTEGRHLVEYLAGKPVAVYVSVATTYGASLLPQAANVTVLIHRMDVRDMTAFIAQYHIGLAIDATHPYASIVTATMKQACRAASVEYIRVVRPVSHDRDYLAVASMEEAVEFLGHTEGTIFLTTGSKDLAVYTALPEYAGRIVLRILSSRQSLDKALSLGYAPARIICMQGPFSKELNLAMFRQYHAAYVVMKDSGRVGGFQEKIEAAKEAGAQAIVITRQAEPGENCREVCQFLDKWIPASPDELS